MVTQGKTIVVVSGGFDPLHSGHLDLLYKAKELGDRLIVGINSDAWLERKKGKALLDLRTRVDIIQSLRMVYGVETWDDTDGTAIKLLEKVKQENSNDTIIFANGGDRDATNIPELVVPNVIFKFGVGGGKKNSSSTILENWATDKVERPWGYWTTLSQIQNHVKTKELVVNPGASLSMQRHQHRAEFWFVAKGRARVHWDFGYTDIKELGTVKIMPKEWHRLENIGTDILHVVEIQHGDSCDESDIERLDS